MNVHWLCKRFYTNKDLLQDRFGRLYHLPVQLARLGMNVTVTAIDYRSADTETLKADGVSFRTAPAALSCLPTLIPRLYRTIAVTPPAILIASGDSHIGYLGLRIAQSIGARFAFDVYDYYPVFAGNRIPGMKTMFRRAVRHSDLVLCASSSLCERLKSSNPRSLLVENGVDPNLFMPGDKHQVRHELGLADDDRIIGYFGSLNRSRGPLLIDACRRLRAEMPNLRVLIAGPVDGVDVTDTWIIHLGAVRQQDVPRLIHACDVVTIPYANDPFNSMAGACKIAEYLACGRPVVATRVSNHEDLFRDAPGSICEPDANSMAEALRRQLRAPEIAPFPEGMTWAAIGLTLHRELVSLAG